MDAVERLRALPAGAPRSSGGRRTGPRGRGRPARATAPGRPRPDRACPGRLGGGLPRPTLHPDPERLSLEPLRRYHDRVARLARELEHGALLLGLLGHHLGDLLVRSPAPRTRLPRRRAVGAAPGAVPASSAGACAAAGRAGTAPRTASVAVSRARASRAHRARRVPTLLVAQLVEQVVGVGGRSRSPSARGGRIRRGGRQRDPVRADRGRPGDRDEQQPRGAEHGDHRRRTARAGVAHHGT